MDTPEERKTAEEIIIQEGKKFYGNAFYVKDFTIQEVARAMEAYKDQEVRFATLESQREIEKLRNQLMKSSDANIEAATLNENLKARVVELEDNKSDLLDRLMESKRVIAENSVDISRIREGLKDRRMMMKEIWFMVENRHKINKVFMQTFKLSIDEIDKLLNPKP